jgi:hypothetical protein
MTVFEEEFKKYFNELKQQLSTDNGDWVVKGFIDIYKNIYTISSDTKVVSKIVELMIFPNLVKFAEANGYSVKLAEHQNHYPDLTFIDKATNQKFAIDLKSTYRKGENLVNGFTLGAFTGYFRQRKSAKNITFPYSDYQSHHVLGIVYDRKTIPTEEKMYTIEELQEISSAVNNFEFIFQQKWRIASTKPGSGNTKNIGSVTKLEALKAGTGPFSEQGVEVFDDYWMNYLTADMARAIDSNVPYTNLAEYFVWKGR